MQVRSRSEEHLDHAADSDSDNSDNTNRSLPETEESDGVSVASSDDGGVENGVENGVHHGHNKLRRSVTDPIDTGSDAASADVGLWLPTLPRYPVAQSQNKSCWSQPGIDIFRVRGKDYLSSKKKVKVPSEHFLLEARGHDFFIASDKHPVDSLVEHTSKILGGTLRMKPSLVINFNFPWGLLIQYYEIPDKYAPLMQDPTITTATSSETAKKEKKEGQEEEEDVEITKKLEQIQFDSPAERLFAKWLISDNDYKNHKLKLIPHVAEGPWAVRSTVKGKPALIGMKLPIKYHMEPGTSASGPFDNKENLAPYLLCELDIGNSSKAAKKIVSVCRRYMTSLTMDIGFVIEGSNEKELPEQMMGAVRTHQVDTKRSIALF